jgi:hypothetical protein
MYDPKPRRFLSEDPISFNGGDHNLYRYVKNNSLSNTDPTGKFKVEFRYRNASIPGVNLNLGYNHADVVVTDDNGKMKSYWARKGTTRFSDGFIVADSELNSYQEGFIFFEGRPSNIQVLLENKKTKCSDDTIRKNKNAELELKIRLGFKIIEESRVPYEPFGTNSNSAAFQVIREVGIVKNLTPKAGVNPIGWDLNPYLLRTNFGNRPNVI